MASYANFINAEVQSHYANETYVNSLDKYSSPKLVLPYMCVFFFLMFFNEPRLLGESAKFFVFSL